MYNAAVPHVKSGTLRILATTDKMVQEPDVPTYIEKDFQKQQVLVLGKVL